MIVIFLMVMVFLTVTILCKVIVDAIWYKMIGVNRSLKQLIVEDEEI